MTNFPVTGVPSAMHRCIQLHEGYASSSQLGFASELVGWAGKPSIFSAARIAGLCSPAY
jgi:hypothetical protein